MHIDAQLRVLLDVNVSLLLGLAGTPSTCRVEKVVEHLVVDLHEGACHEELEVRLSGLLMGRGRGRGRGMG